MFEALETAFTYTFGRHPSWRAYAYAWIVNFGVEKSISVFTFADLSLAICDWSFGSSTL